ncbi:hypothetical protein [Streptomyces sp. NBC_01601]|uniref:hypothetical protein n=1 Tax=Streptomyces sp. NBC_01601 TaxID=2975892 RepID=UPI002E2BC5F1|nr:hypothetical protein [Streptomyces sp. NBC_01601]
MLSDFAEEVVVLEPDHLDDGAGGPGAPHRDQLHALLAQGHILLEGFFPGIVKEMVAGGAQLGQGSAVQFYVDGQLRPVMEDLEMIGATRPFIEQSVRRRTQALANVRFVAGRAHSLLLDHDRVRGVHFLEGDEPAGQEITADLVVDAMGRSSRLSSWLAKEGWPAPITDRMRIDLGYATATFRRGSERPDLVIVHSAPGPASDYQPTLSEPGALAAVEGDRWMVVLAGYHDYRPTTDPDDFLARMRRCVRPLQDVAEDCPMEGDFSSFHFRESQRRQFTSLNRFPGGLAVLGDAMASVNPIYGQGLTLAALEASCLAAHLRSGASPHAPAWGYFRRAAGFVNAAWDLSTTADLAQPHVTGPYPRGYPILRWTGDKIISASLRDPEINRAFMQVAQMRKPPQILTHPRVLLRAARVFMAT